MVRMVVMMLLATLVGAGCGGADVQPGEELPASEISEQELPGLGHVHGLGVNPADDALYVATHFGLWRLGDGDDPERVGDAAHDFMGFGVVGEDEFIASGHPQSADLPPHLGLIRSTDAGETWTSVSLMGEADFHVLRPGAKTTYGWSSTNGELMASTDMKSWKSRGEVSLIDLAIDPSDDEQLLSTQAVSETQITLQRSEDGGRSWSAIDDAPALVRLHWSDASMVWGVDDRGGVWTSGDSGTSWERAGELPGMAQAITARGDAWYAAAGGRLLRSDDSGESWERLYRYED